MEKKIFGLMKPRLTFTTVIGREEHGTGEKQLVI